MVESNLVPFQVLGTSEAVLRIGAEVEVYAYNDPTRMIDVLPDRWDVSVLDEIGKPGAGSLSLWRHDPKLVSSPTVLDWRNVVRIRINHRCVGAFLIQNKKSEMVSLEELSGETWQISGEGLRTWFHDAVVLPYGGLKPRSTGSRMFSFASERGTWYKPAQWLTPVNVHQYTMDPTPSNPWGTAPAQWPDAPAAYWIWGTNSIAGAPEGYNFFRYEFTIAEITGTKSYSVFAAGDNTYQCYIDGQEVLSVEAETFSKTTRADFELSPGAHVLAFRVRNDGGPAALIAALFQAGDAATDTPAIRLTVTGQAGWLVNSYPDPPPGWTPGEIMLTLLAEATARGVRFPGFLTPTFTGAADSNGAVWARSLDWEFTIGTDYFEVIERLEEAVCDLWVDPETLKLHMYAARGTHRTTQSASVSPIMFQAGRNVLRAREEGTSDVKNTLALSTTDGWALQGGGPVESFTKYGRVEGTLSTGLSGAVSGDVANTVFDLRALPTMASTYEIIDVDGARPFVDFGVGDWVLAPNAADVLTPTRILSLAVTEDVKTGTPRYATEFGTIFEDRTTRHERWLKTLSNQSLGGTVANASGGMGSSASGSSAQTPLTGPMGLQGLPGPAGVVWRGPWSAAITYNQRDLVGYAGNTWYALRTSTNVMPVAGLDWSILAAKGGEGPKGDTGLTGALADRLTATVTTPILATGASWSGLITLAVGWRLYRITTSRPARIRLYGTAAKRDVDAPRPVGTDPTGDHGLLFEYVTYTGVLGTYLSPLVDGASFESPASSAVPVTVENKDTGAGTVVLTLIYVRTE